MLQVLIPVVTAVCAAGLTAFVSIKLKFAESEEDLVKDLKQAGLKVFMYVTNGLV